MGWEEEKEKTGSTLNPFFIPQSTTKARVEMCSQKQTGGFTVKGTLQDAGSRARTRQRALMDQIAGIIANNSTQTAGWLLSQAEAQLSCSETKMAG